MAPFYLILLELAPVLQLLGQLHLVFRRPFFRRLPEVGNFDVVLARDWNPFDCISRGRIPRSARLRSCGLARSTSSSAQIARRGPREPILVMPLFVCAQLNGYRLCLGMRIPHQHPWIFVTAYGSDLRHV